MESRKSRKGQSRLQPSEVRWVDRVGGCGGRCETQGREGWLQPAHDGQSRRRWHPYFSDERPAFLPHERSEQTPYAEDGDHGGFLRPARLSQHDSTDRVASRLTGGGIRDSPCWTPAFGSRARTTWSGLVGVGSGEAQAARETEEMLVNSSPASGGRGGPACRRL
jgi:hypothetical protein